MNQNGMDNPFDGLDVVDCNWTQADLTADQQTIADLIDRTATGHSSPRIWAFVARPGCEHATVAVALTAARVLAERGKAVTLIDGDDQQQTLTRWANRQEKDGWIDMMRMGGSPQVCSIPFADNGEQNRLIGVGSFTPTQLTDQEVGDFIDRIALQADDLVIVASPTKAEPLWISQAQIRVLCSDDAEESQPETVELVGSLQEADDPLSALIRLAGQDTEPTPVPAAVPVAPAASDPDPAGIDDEDLQTRNVDWEKSGKVPRSHHLFWGLTAALLVTIAFMLGMMWRPGLSERDAQPEQLVPAVATAVSDLVPDQALQVSAPAGETTEPTADDPLPAGAVGADGWAIHVYSFPESDIAEGEVRRLTAAGYQAEYKEFDLGTQGVWYRVFIGSFRNKDDALASCDDLIAQLDLEWALPVEY